MAFHCSLYTKKTLTNNESRITMITIKIFTGSHHKNTERNESARKEINELLYSDENPLNYLFNTELLYLDDTRGFLSFQSYDRHHIPTDKQRERLNKWIRKHVICDNGSFTVFINHQIFTQ